MELTNDVGSNNIPLQADADRRPNQLDEIPKPARRLIQRIVASPLSFVLILLLAGGVTAAGFGLWRYLQSYQSTDDAQIDGHVHAISSRISGSVARVLVDDNQTVKKGQLLVEIDP